MKILGNDFEYQIPIETLEELSQLNGEQLVGEYLIGVVQKLISKSPKKINLSGNKIPNTL